MYKVKRFFNILTSILLAASISACSSQSGSIPDRPDRPEGCATPEKAAFAYLESFKAFDMDGMLGVFAVENDADSLPVQDDSTKKAEIQEDINKQYSALSQINGSFFGKRENIEPGMENELDLESLVVLGSIPPKALAKAYDTAGSRKLLADRAKRIGADSMESCAAAFEIGGSKYILCVDAVEYDDKWYIGQLGGHLAGLLNISNDFMGILPFAGQDGVDIDSLIVDIDVEQ